MPLLTVSLLALAAAASAPDPVAQHARLLQEGARIAADLAAAEVARQGFDRQEAALTAGDRALQQEIERANAANAAYAARTRDHAAQVAAHNQGCKTRAAPAERPKTKEEKAALEAMAREYAERCNAAGEELAAAGAALDAEGARLAAARQGLQDRIDAQNAAAAAYERDGPAAGARLDAAELAADEWLLRFRAVVDSAAFAARARGIADCGAKREMILDSGDLRTLLGFHRGCAAKLAK